MRWQAWCGIQTAVHAAVLHYLLTRPLHNTHLRLLGLCGCQSHLPVLNLLRFESPVAELLLLPLPAELLLPSSAHQAAVCLWQHHTTAAAVCR